MATAGQSEVDPSLTEERRATLERWKARLLVEGLRATQPAVAMISSLVGERITSHEYATTGGITLDLGSGVVVNAPIDEWFCADASTQLDSDREHLFITAPGEDALEVTYHPHLPGYLEAIDGQGRDLTESCFTHGDRIRLSPIAGCAYKCDYCDLPSERYRLRPVDQLLEALRVALDDPVLPPRHAMVSGGSPGPRHLGWFLDVIAAIAASCPLPLDVMMSAVPEARDVVGRLVDSGVSGFAINLELYGDDASELHIRGKHRKARPVFDEFVTAAVERLGTGGGVRSLVVTGLEPASVSLTGIAHLASLGADPVLSPFRPAERTSLVDRRPPGAEETLDLLYEAREVVNGSGAHLGPDCVACQHNTLTLPWDVRQR